MNGTSSEQRRANLAVASLSLGTALNPLNSSMIAVALVLVRGDFRLSVETVTWVITVFYLASAVAQPLMGRLADRFGPRRLFVFGMAVVVAVCVATPFSPTFALLCTGRVLLAIGTATAFPCAIAMLRTITERAGLSSPRLLGRIQMANTLGAAVGPVIGGILVATLGWPAIFWVNVPLAIAAFAGVRRYAPADDRPEALPGEQAGERTGSRPRKQSGAFRTVVAESDVPGILAFVATLVAALVFLLGLRPEPSWWLIPVALAAGFVFVWRELHCRSPFLDLRLLAGNFSLVMVYLCFAVFNLIYYLAFFGLPQYLEEHAGLPADIVGFLMLPLAALTVIVTPVSARLIERRGLRFTLLLGGAMLLGSAVLLGVVALTTTPVVILLVTAAMGIPYCVVSIAMSQALYASARPQDAGVAAGIFQTARYVGAILSTTALGIVFTSGTTPGTWSVIAAIATVFGLALLGILLRWHPRDSAPDAA